MRRPLLAILTVLSALLVVARAPAQAHAASGSDTTPDPQALLSAAEAAVNAAGTVHFSEKGRFINLLFDTALQMQGDEDFGRQSAQAMAVTNVNGLKDTEYLIQIKRKHWYKAYTSSHRWARGRDPHRLDFTFSQSDPLGVQSGTQDAGVTQVAYATVGADTLNGMAVWHVRQTITEESGGGNLFYVVTDFYLGQADSLPYQVSEVFDDHDDDSSVNETMHFSRWGESLSIKAPTIGSKTP